MEEPVCCTAAPCEAAARHTALLGTGHVLALCREMTPCSSRQQVGKRRHRIPSVGGTAHCAWHCGERQCHVCGYRRRLISGMYLPPTAA